MSTEEDSPEVPPLDSRDAIWEVPERNKLYPVPVDRPSAVKIGPYYYSIYWSQRAWDKLLLSKRSVDTGDIGHSARDDKAIYLMPGPDAQDLANTLLHEILHAIWNESGCNLHNVKDVLDLEEYLVERQTSWLHGVLMENPHVISWLCDHNRKLTD